MLAKSGVEVFLRTTSHLYFQTGEGVTDYREAAWILADDADVEEQISEQSEGFDEQQDA